MQNPILDLAVAVSRTTEENIDLIEGVMRQTGLLAINARVEAARAGTAGDAFGVVARELGQVSSEITRIAKELRGSVRSNIQKLEQVGSQLTRDYQGTRYTDLALNAIEIIDRNLYERSCDVRWWATDSAVVDAAEARDAASTDHACQRLATILRSYTVYLDLWVADTTGRVIASGRGSKYPGVIGRNVAQDDWFRRAMQTKSGDDFVACDITENAALSRASVATYSTAIRREGRTNGAPIGALGIFFDWAPQAAAVVEGLGLAEDERARTRAMIVDSKGTVIASSDARVIGTTFRITPEGKKRGFYMNNGTLTAFALTPGYETYKGLGWYGVLETKLG